MTREGRERLAVVAVGGNALIADPNRPAIPDQAAAVEASIGGLIDMVAQGWTVVLTHGNGPQVGHAMRRSELSAPEVPPMPMDYADADTQGVIGYMFQRALGNALRRRGIPRPVVTVVTQVVVDAHEPAMTRPTKPIGAFLTDEQARRAKDDGWTVIDEPGRGKRRVVPSPEPREIVELPAIRTLVSEDYLVIACGGGGIPVVREESGDLSGIRAVIDKDLTASRLACELGAELLVISTAVERVAMGFGTPEQCWLDRVTASELSAAHQAGEFAPGSMEPKIRASLRFLKRGGRRVVITDPEHITEGVAGRAGTQIEP